MNLPIEQQVSSLKSSMRLRELGCPQDSLFYYTPYYNDLNGKRYGLHLVYCEDDGGTGTPYSFKPEQKYSAYTVDELGEILKGKGIISSWMYVDIDKWNWVCYQPSTRINFTADTEAEARALMLIYLLENKLIEVPR